MALSLNGTSNGSLNNLSLTTNTGTVVDTSVNPFLAYDSYYLNANQTANASPITNWSRRPSSYVQIGGAMTLSTGVFTFPVTGIWLIRYKIFWNFTATANDQYQAYIRTGTSGTPDTSAEGIVEGGGTSGDHLGVTSTQLLFDVTDTTNCVVDFTIDSIGTGNFLVGGSTSYSSTSVEFTKMGET